MMAEVLEGHANHGFLSLVNRTRPALPPGMPSRTEVIVIPDDEDELPVNPRLQNVIERSEAGPSRRPRHNLSASPSKQRDPKRQRMGEESAASSHDAHIKTEFPKIQLNFETDENGATQLYPQFFEEAFIPTAASDDEVVEVFMERPKQKEEEPPYFDDPKLLIRMYRGPGFEQFPIPFKPTHKEFCDEWDAKQRSRNARRILKQTRYNAFGPYIDPTVPVDDTDDENQPKAKLSTAQEECLAKIVDVLPDVKRDFVVDKIRSQQESYIFADEEIEVLPEAATIISEILEMDDYPKETRAEQVPDPYENETGKTIAWTRHHRNNREYLKDAVIMLASQFDYVPTHYIHRIVQEKMTLWDAFVYIDDIDRNYFQRQDRPYLRSKRPRSQLEKKYQRTNPCRDPDYYADLVTELQAAKQHRTRETLKVDENQQKANAENENFHKHKAEGLIVTCGCCFDDEIPINRAVTCTAQVEDHSFCFACVERLANAQIGFMRHQMLCMDGSGCQEKLDVDGVGRAIPYKTFNKILLNEQQAEIAAANLEGLEQCPYCDFKAICDPIEIDTVFSCQNPDCFKVTCRKCHEISHLPKTCEDVRKDRGLSARHRVEEARSAAMMRPCPSCKTNLIKEAGCNKLRCQCGAVMCYACKADLSKFRDGYEHFDRNTSGGKRCALYDEAGVDRHVKEANDAEVEAIKAAREADSTIEEKILQIETGKPATTNTTGALEDKDLIAGDIGELADLRRQVDRAGRRAEARARRRAQVLPAVMPLALAQPAGYHAGYHAGYPVWPGGLGLAANPVQPGDANVDAWRNAIPYNFHHAAYQPGQMHQPGLEQRIRHMYQNPWEGNDHLLDQQHNLDDFEPMDLDFDDDIQAQAQHDLDEEDDITAAGRLNDIRNEIHRRRTHRRRRHSNREAGIAAGAGIQDQIPQAAQQNAENQHAPPNQQGRPVSPFQQAVQDFQQGQFFANPAILNWRAQYRPATPIPQVQNARNVAANILVNRGNPPRRGTVPVVVNLPGAMDRQAGAGNGNANQEQVDIQHRPQNDLFYGVF